VIPIFTPDGIMVGRLLGGISADRLEHQVEIVPRAAGREQPRVIEMRGAEIVEDGPALVDQDLDVNQLHRLMAVFQEALAEGEAAGAFAIGPAGAFEIFGAGSPEDPRRGRPGGDVSRIRRSRDLEEDLAQLGASMRTDDDRLAAFEIDGVRIEPPHVMHHAEANQVRVFHASLVDPPRVGNSPQSIKPSSGGATGVSQIPGSIRLGDRTAPVPSDA